MAINLAFLFLANFAQAQVFLTERDGTTLSLGYPDSLSAACQATYNQTVQCNSTLGSVAFDGLFPSANELAILCTSDCLGSLQSFRSQQSQVCSAESYQLDGQLVPASYNIDLLLFTYNYTCIRDTSTKDFCAPLVDQWSQNGPTAEQSCSDCMLHTFQVELDSSFAYDDEFANYFRSLTSSCGASGYPITSPPPYTVSTTATTTSSSAASSESCASTYTLQDGDTCSSISEKLSVSTAMLRYQNDLAADCSNLPETGTSLCVPSTCKLHVLQANETCYGITQAYDGSFTVTQMVSWNPDINRDCSNLEALVGAHLCVSAPGTTGGSYFTSTAVSTTQVPTSIPSNVVAGTNTRCARYYEVVPGDTCSSVTVMMGISLTDFFFLNPEINNPNCTNLFKGYSYCVEAVGDITTYPGYGGNTNPCLTVPVPSTCMATGAVSTDTAWTFPTYTTTATQPTSLPLAPGTWSNCSTYTQYYTPLRNTSTVNTCYVVSTIYDVDVLDFVSWNPSLSYDAANPGNCQLQPGYQYCVQLTVPSATPTITITSQTSATTTQEPTSTGANGEATPLPIQSGMISNCGKFELVTTNASCYDIAAANSITLSEFYSWNPALNGDCSGLYPDYYVCVGLLSGATPTTTSNGGANTTPTPTQSGMASDCDRFYLVQKDDGCADIATAEGISLSDLYSWNPALDGDCSGLWPDYYICVGRSGSGGTTTTTTTSAPGGTPTPTQAGMTAGCQSFYLVKSGDGCYDIATSHGIALDQFYAYNPAVGNDCSGLWPDYYVCVGK